MKYKILRDLLILACSFVLSYSFVTKTFHYEHRLAGYSSKLNETLFVEYNVTVVGCAFLCLHATVCNHFYYQPATQLCVGCKNLVFNRRHGNEKPYNFEPIDDSLFFTKHNQTIGMYDNFFKYEFKLK